MDIGMYCDIGNCPLAFEDKKQKYNLCLYFITTTFKVKSSFAYHWFALEWSSACFTILLSIAAVYLLNPSYHHQLGLRSYVEGFRVLLGCVRLSCCCTILSRQGD